MRGVKRFAATLLFGFAGISTAIAMASDATVLTGTIIEGGVECPLFQATDGAIFALMGIDPSLVTIGTTLQITGQEAMMSTCQQGTAFQVDSATVTPAS